MNKEYRKMLEYEILTRDFEKINKILSENNCSPKLLKKWNGEPFGIIFTAEKVNGIIFLISDIKSELPNNFYDYSYYFQAFDINSDDKAELKFVDFIDVREFNSSIIDKLFNKFWDVFAEKDDYMNNLSKLYGENLNKSLENFTYNSKVEEYLKDMIAVNI